MSLGTETKAPLLDYAAPTETLRRLTLKHADGAVRVIFPTIATWVPIAVIVIEAVAGAARPLIAIWMVVAMRRLFLQFRNVSPDQLLFLRHFEIGVFIVAVPESLFWWTVAGFQYWKFRRFGRVPRVLEASGEGLVLTWLGWWRMRERRWSAGEIASVECCKLKGNLNWRRTVANLVVTFRNGRSRRFRLSSRDPQLPGEIAMQLANALGCPLR